MTEGRAGAHSQAERRVGVGARRQAERRIDAGASRTAGPSRLYVVETWVPRRTTIPVGSLGPVTFERGWYAYVGSARRGRDARVARHLRAEKPLRWHADYLFAVFPGRAAWLVDGALTECELAEALTARDDPAGAPARGHGAARRPPRFGAGDCRCAGHLVYMPGRLTKQRLRATLACIGDVRIASSTWA